MSSACNGKQKIVYAWAQNASKLVLPSGIGFRFTIELLYYFSLLDIFIDT